MHTRLRQQKRSWAKWNAPTKRCSRFNFFFLLETAPHYVPFNPWSPVCLSAAAPIHQLSEAENTVNAPELRGGRWKGTLRSLGSAEEGKLANNRPNQRTSESINICITITGTAMGAVCTELISVLSEICKRGLIFSTLDRVWLRQWWEKSSRFRGSLWSVL